MSQTIINVKYKDRLFRLVFQDKSDLLDLYNALNQSDYGDAEALEITTLDDVVYMGMKNDISFLIDDILNLFEHQSTYNPNMPIRGLFYLSTLYRKYAESRKLNLYSRSLVKLPFPQYLVFYNGLKDEPDRKVFHLSDAFENHTDSEPCLEVKAVMININLGHNRELMERCRQLKEYAQFIAVVRDMISKELTVSEAVDGAVKKCIKDGILADFLATHRAEVLDMVLTEYDEQSHMASERAEAKAEGLAEGKAEGLAEGRSKGTAEAILELLSDIGQVSQELRDMIMEQTNLQVLKKWLKAASRAETMEEFSRSVNSR